MARRKLKQSKAAKAARRRYRANKRYDKKRFGWRAPSKARKRKKVKRGCGKRGWSRGGNAYWKCKPGRKKHAYRRGA